MKVVGDFTASGKTARTAPSPTSQGAIALLALIAAAWTYPDYLRADLTPPE